MHELYGPKQKFLNSVVALLTALACGIVTSGGARGDQASSTLRSATSNDAIETAVELPQSLTQIYGRGGVPESLPQLIEMERQQQIIAARASACTVNVSIGPAQGCGVIVTGTGYILTAAHVGMRPGKNATVTFSNGRTASATTLGMNRKVDAGLMKINEGQNNGLPWPHASLGRSEGLRTGMWCIASGHPGGYDRERGPVMRVGRILRVNEGSIVTDCALIGGDSGGPLFDLSGKLIAVHSRIGNDVADNLHIPIQHYDESWDRLTASEAWGYLEGFKPVLGISGRFNHENAQVFGVKVDSPAEVAGIKVGDVIEQFGDVAISDFESLTAAISDTMPGERVQIWIKRGGEHSKRIIEIGRAHEDMYAK